MRLYTQCLTLLLRPVVTFCMKRGIQVQDLIESVKIVFVDLAAEELERGQHEISISKINLITGLHRRDVTRLYQFATTKEQDTGLVTRVIGQWQSDKRFRAKSGKGARLLSYEGAESEFALLIATVSKELNAYTVLFEMERIGAVEKSKKGLKLITRAFLPPKGDLKESINLLAKDCEDLMSAVESNLNDDLKIKNLHLKTEYDNIPESCLPKIRSWVLKEGSAFHEKVRGFISTFDRDINPEVVGCGPRRRIAVGTFSRVQNFEQLAREKEHDK